MSTQAHTEKHHTANGCWEFWLHPQGSGLSVVPHSVPVTRCARATNVPHVKKFCALYNHLTTKYNKTIGNRAYKNRNTIARSGRHTMTKLTVTTSEATLQTITEVAARRNKTVDQLVSELLDKATKDMCYRMERNKQVAAQSRALKNQLPELIAKAKEAGIDTSMFE
jgi:hypothetical protein